MSSTSNIMTARMSAGFSTSHHFFLSFTQNNFPVEWIEILVNIKIYTLKMIVMEE